MSIIDLIEEDVPLVAQLVTHLRRRIKAVGEEEAMLEFASSLEHDLGVEHGTYDGAAKAMAVTVMYLMATGGRKPDPDVIHVPNAWAQS